MYAPLNAGSITVFLETNMVRGSSPSCLVEAFLSLDMGSSVLDYLLTIRLASFSSSTSVCPEWWSHGEVSFVSFLPPCEEGKSFSLR